MLSNLLSCPMEFCPLQTSEKSYFQYKNTEGSLWGQARLFCVHNILLFVFINMTGNTILNVHCLLLTTLSHPQAQKKNYRREKKRVTKELLSALKDPSIIVMGDHLKVTYNEAINLLSYSQVTSQCLLPCLIAQWCPKPH